MNNSPYYGSAFRIKIETMIRIIQTHGGKLYRQFGPEVSQTYFNNLYQDGLQVLFSTRFDNQIDYSSDLSDEYNLFCDVVTKHFNQFNDQTAKLYDLNLPAVTLITRFNIMLAKVCDTIVHQLAVEFENLYKSKPQENE